MTAINATLEVDFLGQCASESLGTDYWSSSGGQADFARGALYAGGQSFIVLHSTPRTGPSRGSCPLAARRRGHLLQEHRRQGGHRVGRGRVARAFDPRAHRAPDRDRAPEVPRRADRQGPRVRLHLDAEDPVACSRWRTAARGRAGAQRRTRPSAGSAAPASRRSGSGACPSAGARRSGSMISSTPRKYGSQSSLRSWWTAM